MKNKDAYGKKISFLTLLDGIDEYPGRFQGIDSFSIGVCKLEVIDDILHIYLRRPGLLIGRKGYLIDALVDELGFGVKIHEVNLLGEDPEFSSNLKSLGSSLMRFFRSAF